MNRIGAALSTDSSVDAAVVDCAERAMEQLGGETPHVGLLFTTPHHASQSIASDVARRTGLGHLFGCSGESIVGADKEVEGTPGMVLWLAHLPDAVVSPFRLGVVRNDEGGVEVQGMPGIGQRTAEQFVADGAAMFIVGDPFSFPVDAWVRDMNEHFEGLPVLGGIASGGHAPGQSRLYYGDHVVDDGAVGVLLEGARIETIVSQGCRPIGKPMVITKAHENVIEEVAGRPPLAQLQSFFDEADEAEKALIQRAAQGGLQVGQVVDEHISSPSGGDYLVRNVMGADQETGSMLISDYARVGRTVCFHVRDAEAADEDLKEMLAEVSAEGAAGALMFSCNGRGSRLFDAPDHDVGCMRDRFGDLPLAGFFAAGEIGPVGSKNFLHGFTASIALFLE
jgi:small ligand-binding sensory domain FIST